MDLLHKRFNIDLSLPRILFILVRFLQFVLALTVIGLYGVDLNNARKQGKYVDGKWLFAVIVAAMSAFVALFQMMPWQWVINIPFAFVGDVVLWILWIAVFGIFGRLYINTKPQGQAGIIRMMNAVWVDLTNALLWFMTAGLMALYWQRNRLNRSQFTGRAAV